MWSEDLRRYLREPSAETYARFAATAWTHVRDTAASVVGKRPLADDVAQNVLLALLERPPDPGHVRSETRYLTTMAVNAARMALRAESRRRRREARKATSTEAHTEDGLSPQRREEVRAAVDDLPLELRVCVRLRYFEGLSPQDIARRLGRSPSTVERRLRRALLRLRRRLSESELARVLPALMTCGGRFGSLRPARPGRHPLRSPPSLPRRGVWARAAVASLVALSASTLALKQSGDLGGAPIGAERRETRHPAPGTVIAESPPPGRASRSTGAPPAPPGGRPGDVPTRSRRAPTTRRPLAGAPTGGARMPNGVPVHLSVVTSDGDLVREGRLLVTLPSPLARARDEYSGRPTRVETLDRDVVERVALQDENPVRRSWRVTRSDMLLAVEAIVPGYPRQAPVLFDPNANEGAYVELPLPSRPVSTVGVYDAVTGAPVCPARVEAVVKTLRAKPLELSSWTSPEGEALLHGARGRECTLAVRASGYRSVELRRRGLADREVIWLHPSARRAEGVVRVTAHAARAEMQRSADIDWTAFETSARPPGTGGDTLEIPGRTPGPCEVALRGGLEGWDRPRAGSPVLGVLAARVLLAGSEEKHVRLGWLPARSGAGGADRPSRKSSHHAGTIRGTVHARRPGGLEVRVSRPGGPVRWTTTRPDGTFEVDGPAAGRFEVTVYPEPPNRTWGLSQEVAARRQGHVGASADVVLRLDRTGWLLVRAAGPRGTPIPDVGAWCRPSETSGELVQLRRRYTGKRAVELSALLPVGRYDLAVAARGEALFDGAVDVRHVAPTLLELGGGGREGAGSLAGVVSCGPAPSRQESLEREGLEADGEETARADRQPEQ